MITHFSGNALHIRGLTQATVDTFNVRLKGAQLENCIEIYGEDMGECLAAVVELPTQRLIWSDEDAAGTEIANPRAFVGAVVAVLDTLFPHLNYATHH